jgi:hypothetical protein
MGMIMTEETPKRPYPNLKWYPDSSGNMTIREAEAGLNNACVEIKKLRAALREIAAVSKIVAKGEDMEKALMITLASHCKIARTALGEKTDV